ncbi:MAG: glycosyl hydrolase 43 family protein [Saprospiraceae bacterium]|nr:glycosyl hydrolase 43 family protein [Saprospiraceae bacterium]
MTILKKITLPLILFTTFLARTPTTAQQTQTGTWGDQGDGTYINPVLNADYPDVDIEQLGDTYYMISSKQHMSPGMVILESKDMVNWRSIGHVWDSLSWGPEYQWDRMNGYSFGVWAGDLAYHEGTWFCYQIDFNHGLYVSTAPDIRGPWSAPHHMLSSDQVLDDPGVFWDEETHQAYLICNTAGKQKSATNTVPGNENRIYKMSWDGKQLLDAGQLVYTGLGAEAAKIYRIDSTWYIFMAEWFLDDPNGSTKIPSPENDRKQIVLRSDKSIYGPYEKKVVLERGNGFSRSCSQGGLMQAPDGSWWYMHQLIQNTDFPFQGRPQCLEPVSWKNGWPIIGVDVDGDDIGEPVRQSKKPILGQPVAAPASDDDFGTESLGVQWEWNHNPKRSNWSLTDRPGWLRLKAGMPLQIGAQFGPRSNQWTNAKGSQTLFWRVYNTLSQRIMGTTRGVAKAKFDVSNMSAGQRAGFVRFGGVYHLIGVIQDDHGQRNLFFMDKLGNETMGPAISSTALFIRTNNRHNQAFFEYSFDDQKYQRFGPNFTIEFGNWTGDRLGFFTWNDKEEKGQIDVDWFKYDYNGPKG